MPGSKPRRLRSPVSGSWAARWRRLSSWRADSIALIAWFANARSACSDSSEGSSQSSGSSTHTMPASRPSRSCSGTKSQWWNQAQRPAAVVDRGVDAEDVGRRAARAAAWSMTTQPWRRKAGSSSGGRASSGNGGKPATCSPVKPTPESGTRRPPGWSARNTITFWKPSASRMPSQTASSMSSAELRPVSWEDTRRRCSTAARWRRPSAVLWASSSAIATCAATALSSSSSTWDGAAAGDGLVDPTMPSTSPAADRSGTISASSGCHAPGSSTIGMSGV